VQLFFISFQLKNVTPALSANPVKNPKKV